MVGGAPVCTGVSLSISTNQLQHFVIRGRPGLVSLVTHGSIASGDGVDFVPSLWGRHPSPLTLAPPHPKTAWTGTLYMIAMYDRFLSNGEISAKLAAGPPNSLPATISSLSILEDATTTLYP